MNISDDDWQSIKFQINLMDKTIKELHFAICQYEGVALGVKTEASKGLLAAQNAKEIMSVYE